MSGYAIFDNPTEGVVMYDSTVEAAAPFLMSRLILRARIIPDSITPDTDDPAVEKRLDEAIRALMAERDMAP